MNGREIECLVTFCCSFSAWKYVRQKVGCYYQLHATSIPQYHSSYSQPTISPSVDVIALTPGPLDSTLYFHQWKYSSWVLNLPPNLLEDLSLGEQEFRLPFLSAVIRQAWTLDLLLIHAPVGRTIMTCFLAWFHCFHWCVLVLQTYCQLPFLWRGGTQETSCYLVPMPELFS